MEKQQITWYGKQIEECTKVELIECINFMNDKNFSYNQWVTNDSRKEAEKLKEENTKLWNILQRI